jgi:hypothetical protein
MAEKIEKYSLAMTTCHFKMILKCQIWITFLFFFKFSLILCSIEMWDLMFSPRYNNLQYTFLIAEQRVVAVCILTVYNNSDPTFQSEKILLIIMVELMCSGCNFC